MRIAAGESVRTDARQPPDRLVKATAGRVRLIDVAHKIVAVLEMGAHQCPGANRA
jgi:hypothetical protein